MRFDAKKLCLLNTYIQAAIPPRFLIRVSILSLPVHLLPQAFMRLSNSVISIGHCHRLVPRSLTLTEIAENRENIPRSTYI